MRRWPLFVISLRFVMLDICKLGGMIDGYYDFLIVYMFCGDFLVIGTSLMLSFHTLHLIFCFFIYVVGLVFSRRSSNFWIRYALTLIMEVFKWCNN